MSVYWELLSGAKDMVESLTGLGSHLLVVSLSLSDSAMSTVRDNLILGEVIPGHAPDRPGQSAWSSMWSS